ncbi:MAG: hypothetical protein M1815_004493 [Lichina confinis]|nr:MAG: hypothetical protein M1815_004493 [Lichina confinis]
MESCRGQWTLNHVFNLGWPRPFLPDWIFNLGWPGLLPYFLPPLPGWIKPSSTEREHLSQKGEEDDLGGQPASSAAEQSAQVLTKNRHLRTRRIILRAKRKALQFQRGDLHAFDGKLAAAIRNVINSSKADLSDLQSVYDDREQLSNRYKQLEADLSELPRVYVDRAQVINRYKRLEADLRELQQVYDNREQVADRYTQLEADYEEREAELERMEYDTERVEKGSYSLAPNLRPDGPRGDVPPAAPQVQRATPLPVPAPPQPATSLPPVLHQYLTQIGELNLVQEQLGDLLQGYFEMREQEKLYRLHGRPFSTDPAMFWSDFNANWAKALSRLEEVQTKVAGATKLARDQGLISPTLSPSRSASQFDGDSLMSSPDTGPKAPVESRDPIAALDSLRARPKGTRQRVNDWFHWQMSVSVREATSLEIRLSRARSEPDDTAMIDERSYFELVLKIDGEDPDASDLEYTSGSELMSSSPTSWSKHEYAGDAESNETTRPAGDTG